MKTNSELSVFHAHLIGASSILGVAIVVAVNGVVNNVHTISCAQLLLVSAGMLIIGVISEWRVFNGNPADKNKKGA